MRRVYRLSAVVILLALLAVLCIHYGETYDENWPWTSTKCVTDISGEPNRADYTLCILHDS